MKGIDDAIDKVVVAGWMERLGRVAGLQDAGAVRHRWLGALPCCRWGWSSKSGMPWHGMACRLFSCSCTQHCLQRQPQLFALSSSPHMLCPPQIKAQEEVLRQELADMRAKEAERGSDIPALIQERDECREICKVGA